MYKFAWINAVLTKGRIDFGETRVWDIEDVPFNERRNFYFENGIKFWELPNKNPW